MCIWRRCSEKLQVRSMDKGRHETISCMGSVPGVPAGEHKHQHVVVCLAWLSLLLALLASAYEEHQQRRALKCLLLSPTPFPPTCHSSCLPFTLLRSECWLAWGNDLAHLLLSAQSQKSEMGNFKGGGGEQPRPGIKMMFLVPHQNQTQGSRSLHICSLCSSLRWKAFQLQQVCTISIIEKLPVV